MPRIGEVLIVTIAVLLFMEMGRICLYLITNMLNSIEELLKEKHNGK